MEMKKKKSVFWSTNVLLYWAIREEPGFSYVKEIVEWQKKEGMDGFTSSFALAELLQRPIEKGDEALARKYTEIVDEMGCQDFGKQEALAFACIRSDYPDIKPPEVIQLACAVVRGVDYFFTTERRLARYEIDGIGQIIYLKSWYEDRVKAGQSLSR